MLIDYEEELTTSGGQAITATVAGTRYYDGKGSADVGLGAPDLAGVARVVGADFNNATSFDIAIQACDDSSGTNAVTIATKNIPLSGLTVARGPFNVGVCSAGIRKRWLRAYITVNGAAPSQGKLKVWLADTKSMPANVTFTV